LSFRGERSGADKLVEWWPKPLRTALSKRPTLILDKPLVELLGLDPPQVVLPPGVTEEEAIETVRELWGKKLAAGIADRAGLTGKERETFIESWSRVVAQGLVK